MSKQDERVWREQKHLEPGVVSRVGRDHQRVREGGCARRGHLNRVLDAVPIELRERVGRDRVKD